MTLPAATGTGPPGDLVPFHWDIHSGVRASDAPLEPCLTVGEPGLALVSRSGGIAADMLGFRISRPGDLLLR